MSVSVVVPTLNACNYLPRLVEAIRDQTIRPNEILVIDSSSDDGTAELAIRLGCKAHSISRASFNHGATRNLAATLVPGDVLVFMTQDAQPANSHFLEKLTTPVKNGVVAATYARQIPYDGATPLERFARSFNYPEDPETRSVHDIDQRGIRAFFFSNVAAAVSRHAFAKVGMFPQSVIMNEDMFLCAKLLRAGYQVRYESDAVVYHSHNYDLLVQFRRYFDIGAALEQGGVLLAGAHMHSEGWKFFRKQARFLLENSSPQWMVRSLAEAAVKYAGLQLGRRFRLFPQGIKRYLSLHAFYWEASNE